LKNQGINFDKHVNSGINPQHFYRLLKSSRLFQDPSITWITYQGDFDLAYIIKIMMNKQLPKEFNVFY